VKYTTISKKSEYPGVWQAEGFSTPAAGEGDGSSTISNKTTTTGKNITIDREHA
jgi:hypothetical protein